MRLQLDRKPTALIGQFPPPGLPGRPFPALLRAAARRVFAFGTLAVPSLPKSLPEVGKLSESASRKHPDLVWATMVSYETLKTIPRT